MNPQSIKGLYARHQRWVPILFFGLGFVFDAFMLRRIDEFRTLIQQALYLLVSAVLIGVEMVEGVTHEFEAPRWIAKVWKYREAFLHFLLGTLLNSYTIFYFKSASTLTSFSFIALLILILTLNEFKRFGKSQTQVHMAFWSLCLVSYFVSLSPIVLGFMGVIPFMVGVLGSLIVFWLYFRALKRSLKNHPRVLNTHVFAPFLAIQLLFVALYFAHAIPPVPLSVKYMGIFHGITKADGDYRLSFTRSKWKFWQHGDQTFLARPGDTIYCFAKVYSPSRFSDKLQVRWLYWDKRRGWTPSDAIPMAIEGGREEGYRGITKKTNFQPGDWRVEIETVDKREVGRISFRVENDSSTDERETTTLVK